MGFFCLPFVGLYGLVKDSVERWMSRKPMKFSTETTNCCTLPSGAKYSSQPEKDEPQEAPKVANQTNTPSIKTTGSHIVSPRVNSSRQVALREGQKTPKVSDHIRISQIERTETQPITPSGGPSSWENKFDRNLRRSPLMRLPDELLLLIMQTLATVDIYMLRQVSFTFWRIYQDKTFAEFHCLKKDDRRQECGQWKLYFASPVQLGGRRPTSTDRAGSKYDPNDMVSFTPRYAPRVMLKTCVPSQPWDGNEVYKHSLGFHWCLPVSHVTEKEQVTDIGLYQELRALGQEYGDLLCPHVTYDDGQLLRPFDPRSCSCLETDSRAGAAFGAKTPVEGCEFESWSCKALTRENERDKTMFIPFGTENCHKVECRGCDTTYQWHRFDAHVF
ncbi:hypothetical protein CMEL01_12767 [Colletotrichum melonis]|uniref:F-box domain-containing protein n=1 Tax=Colletotrichum melonis TaxID=1209925 RepID=A0AAI9XU88_9PEZI|nr:hypothetical protein CMEL01_12767 [Colletotrichum melonis]